MKKCGIICEYNPLHNGHIRHITAAKKDSGCDALICVMGGNFVQRGEGAAINKFERARHAVLAGADVVVELPAVFAINSAQDFAYGAVMILNALNCSVLHFGSEDGEIGNLKGFANFLTNPSAEFQKGLKENLGKGMSYAASVSNAVQPIFQSNLLTSPNNSLGIEYLKAISLFNSPMTPMTIKRDDNYNTPEITNPFCSATAIRHSLKAGKNSKIKDCVPDYVYKTLMEESVFDNDKLFEFQHDFFATLTPAVLKNILGVEEGLENRFIKFAGEASYQDMLTKIKSKRYTMLKLKRVMLNAVLGITKELMEKAKKTKPYFRVLALEENRLDILSDFSECSGINSVKELTFEQKAVYDVDVRATNLYQSLQKQRGNVDYTLPLQKIKRPE